jgi:cysteine desulfurase
MAPRVYLDWNATAPLRSEARAAMVAAFDVIGNPSSVHAEGRAARRLVEETRAAVAAATGSEARNVVLTSGGTEANAMVLTPGLRRGHGPPLARLVASAIEHPSVVAGGRFAPAALAVAPVGADGVVDLARLHALLTDGGPALVSIMAANNETGALQPIPEIAAMVHGTGSLLHVDAVQAFGKIDCDINRLHCDLLTVSSHKIGGPKGVGALVMADDVVMAEALVRGGGQERGRRAGTENVPGIAGFGAAVTATMQAMVADVATMRRLQCQLEAGLKSVPGTVIFAENAPRLPNTTLFAAPGLKAETAVIGFDLEGVAVSSGAACSSGKVQPSHVLVAMGVAPALVHGAVRLSLGWDTTIADVEHCIAVWKKLAKTLCHVLEGAAG